MADRAMQVLAADAEARDWLCEESVHKG